jgi:TetR/AcrR family transcriptional regulator, repressor for neighboring sulfatase
VGPAKSASKPRRQRRSPAAVRAATLHAGRTLLFRAGPEAITMPAVAKELGMSHGNLTHHFGSIGALHAALVDQMAQELATAAYAAVGRLREDQADPIDVVNAVFQAFGEGGAGHLISWLALSDNIGALKPLFKTITKAVRELSEDHGSSDPDRVAATRQNALVLIATGLGNALIGDQLHAAVGLPPGALAKASAQRLVLRAGPKRR